MPNGGNLGDAMIASATIQGFNKYNISWDFIFGNEGCINNADMLVYGGGGSLVPRYKGGIECVQYLLSIGSKVVVLPQTVHGHVGVWNNAKGLTVFARDNVSFENISDYRNVEAYFYHDLATELDVSEEPFSLARGIRDSLIKSERTAHLEAFRHDGEEIMAKPKPYFDISGSVYPSMRSEPVIHASTCGLLASLANYTSVSTDRLHTAIAASLLGIPVDLYDTHHKKNSAVYDSTLRHKYGGTLSFIEAS